MYNINFDGNKKCEFNLNLEKYNTIKVKKHKEKKSKKKCKKKCKKKSKKKSKKYKTYRC